MNNTHKHTAATAASTRANTMRLAHYRDIMRFEDGDARSHVWMTADAAAHPAAHYLLECAVYREGVFSKPRGLIMTPSGFESLLAGCPHASALPELPLNHRPAWAPHPAETLAPELTDEQKGGWLAHNFLRFKRQHAGSFSCGNLHVAKHPMVHWQADDEWKEEEHLISPLPTPETLPISEHAFIEMAVLDNFDGSQVVVSRNKAFLKRLTLLLCERYGESAEAFMPMYLDDKGFLVIPEECDTAKNPEIVAALAAGEARRSLHSESETSVPQLEPHIEEQELCNEYHRAVIYEDSEDQYHDGVWLTSDAALHPAAHYLLELAVFKRGVFSKARGLIMTPAGFAKLQAAAGAETAALPMLPPNYCPQWRPHPADTLGLELTDEQKAGWLLHNFRRFERRHDYCLSFGNLHVAANTDVEWVEDAELWGEHVLTCRAPRENYPALTERQFLEEIVRRLDGIQVVISRDMELLQHLAKLSFSLHGSDGVRLWLYYLNDDGSLLPDPDGCSEDELPAELARGNQRQVILQSCICMDINALHHRHAAKFLRDSEPLFRETGTQLHVLAREDAPLPQADLLHDGAGDEPPTICFTGLDKASTKVEALSTALAKVNEQNAASGRRLVLVTDHVLRGEAIQKRLMENDEVPLDVYSISRYGYLTLRAKANPRRVGNALLNGIDSRSSGDFLSPEEERKARAEAACRSMKDALAEHDIEEVRRLSRNADALTTGIREALKADDVAMLQEMLRSAERIPSFAMRWWLLECKMFREPRHLAECPIYYHRLVRALPKVEFPKALAVKIQRRLQQMSLAEDAAQAELGFLAKLFEEALAEADDAAESICIARQQLPRELPHSEAPEVVHLCGKRQLISGEHRHISRKVEELEKQLEHLRDKLEEYEQDLAEMEADIAELRTM